MSREPTGDGIGFDGLFDELCTRRGIGCALTDAALVVQAIGGARHVWGTLSAGDPLTDALPELLGAEQAIEEAVAGGEPYVLPWLNRTGPSGGQRFYELSVHVKSDDPTVRVHWLVDVTGAGRLKSELNQERNELSLTRDALALRNADLQLFLRAAGHDLKSPLRTLEGFLGLIAAESDSPLVDASRSLAVQLAELVEVLLDYARLGSTAIESQPVSLSAAAQNAVDRLALSIAERGAQIELPPSLPTVLGDRTLVGQVVYNLLDNALKYCPADRAPIVRLSAEPRIGRTALIVEDNGRGIPVESRQRIFEPLVRLGSAASGHGFGLATVRRCVELMGGRVTVSESAALGGARFEVELPV